MRYVFIVNPNAGGGKGYDTIYSKAEKYFSDKIDTYKVYLTEYPGHATEIVEKELESGERIRFYGVGGDGTLLEVSRGCVGKENAEVGIFPVGSGNDYVRTFGSKEQFLSFHRQMKGQSIKVDAIETNNGTAINICSVGLDAAVAYEMDKFKVIPGVSGSLAYDLALGKVLGTGKLSSELQISVKTDDGEESFEGDYMFVLAASGQWYGGGYHGAPKSVVNDGLLDFIFIKRPALYRIPGLIGIYKGGAHLEGEKAVKLEDILTYRRGYEVSVKAKNSVVCNRDGECDKVLEERFRILPGAVNFILPLGVTYGDILETDRLILRHWKNTDFDDYAEFVTDPDVRIIANSSVAKTKEDIEKALKHDIQNQSCYAIVLKETGKAIGYIKYQNDGSRHIKTCRSIGYEINKNFWGYGYATEALKAMVTNAFENKDTTILSAGHFTGNEGSKRVIEKCGFTFEGITRQCCQTADGKVADAHCYSLTKEEYLEKYN